MIPKLSRTLGFDRPDLNAATAQAAGPQQPLATLGAALLTGALVSAALSAPIAFPLLAGIAAYAAFSAAGGEKPQPAPARARAPTPTPGG